VVRPSGNEHLRVGLRVPAAKGAKRLGRGTHSPHWRWHFIELGTAKMAAKPFLRPALDSNAEAVVAALRAELAAGIQRAIRRKARGG
jgi:HK97 gp10 family phage protein